MGKSMDNFHLRIFQQQVLDQCHFLLASAKEVDRGLTQHDIRHVFYGIQNLLSAGANISKMLWGQGGKRSEQRKRLRDSIGISDNSPIREVTMRNHFEHMDERIDRWWSESQQHNYADKNIGPKDRTLIGLDNIDMFRLFDPETTEIVFWGQEFNLRSIVNEVRKILPLLQKEANKPHWEEPDPR